MNPDDPIFVGDYNSIGSQLAVWKDELVGDSDQNYLLEGITNGFRITDGTSGVKQSTPPSNHRSAEQHRHQVEKELRSQIAAGHYVMAASQPAIISPIAAVPKRDSTAIRLIHDGSRPVGEAMNDFATLHSVKYESIDNAVKLAQQNYFMAKVDLKSAYRYVPIHPDDYRASGLRWKFDGDSDYTDLFDSRLPFGSRLGPSIFHRLSTAVKRFMARRGYNCCVVYLDDFLIVCETKEMCNEALHVLIRLLRSLGFGISWPKVIGPTQSLVFLGILIDTTQCTLGLDAGKLGELKSKLQAFRGRKRATKRQLQSLAGLLNWACQAIRGGFFLRRILDAQHKLKHSKHKVYLSADFHLDVDWWWTYLHAFNGVTFYQRHPEHILHVDACPEAAGMFYAGDWQYTVWHQDWPLADKLHINYKEVLAAVCAARLWAPWWQDGSVFVYTDSTVAKAILNKGRSHCKLVNSALRELFWLSEHYGFTFRALHIPGSINHIPDCISRLHEPGQVVRLQNLFNSWFHGQQSVMTDFYDHMSLKTAAFLSLQGRRRHWRLNS